MTSKIFYDSEHADRYLRNSIITLKGQPIYVQKVGVKARIDTIYYYTAPFDGSIKTIACKDSDIDMTPIPLGLTNTLHEGRPRVVDISRMPQRAWKVGLTKNNIFARCIVTDQTLYGQQFIPSVELCNTVIGKYPKYQTAIETMGEMRTGTIAFSRIFAIDSAYRLLHKHYPRIKVGRHSPRGKTPILEDKFNWMQEVLQESLNG